MMVTFWSDIILLYIYMLCYYIVLYKNYNNYIKDDKISLLENVRSVHSKVLWQVGRWKNQNVLHRQVLRGDNKLGFYGGNKF